jgi:hypothetical protein
MSQSDPHAVDPDDEERHLPSDDPLWNESHYLDVVSHDGRVAGYVRIGLYPNLGVTWWTAMVVGPDRPVVASIAYDLPVPELGLGLHGSGFAMSTDVEVPLDRVRVHGRAPAAVFDEPAAIYRDEPGRPTTIALDLTWTTDGIPYQYDVTTRYEIPCLVAGTITAGDEVMAVEGHGQRDHSWGVRDWWAFGWCWFAGRLDDGTRVHGADIRIPGHPLALGYVQEHACVPVTVTGLDVTEVTDADGLPTTGRARIEPGGIDLTIDPVAFGPLVLTATDGRVSRFPRAQVRLTAADGRRGSGWVEWNQPQPTPEGR